MNTRSNIWNNYFTTNYWLNFTINFNYNRTISSHINSNRITSLNIRWNVYFNICRSFISDCNVITSNFFSIIFIISWIPSRQTITIRFIKWHFYWLNIRCIKHIIPATNSNNNSTCNTISNINSNSWFFMNLSRSTTYTKNNIRFSHNKCLISTSR